mgnify:FL=1
MAKLCKVSVGLLRKIENENYLPRYQIRQRIAQFLNLSLNQLFFEVQENEIEKTTD